MKYSIASTVRLISGGPTMVVTEGDCPNGSILRCIWFDTSHKLQRADFPASALCEITTAFNTPSTTSRPESASRVSSIIEPLVEYQIDPNQISQQKLNELFETISPIACGGTGGTIQMTDLLAIVSFPPEVQQRIRNARGPVRISNCTSSSAVCQCSAANNGQQVEENIPGAGGAIGIIIEEQFTCRFTVHRSSMTVDVTDIRGLRIDLLGPVNPAVDRILIEVPTRRVVLTI